MFRTGAAASVVKEPARIIVPGREISAEMLLIETPVVGGTGVAGGTGAGFPVPTEMRPCENTLMAPPGPPEMFATEFAEASPPPARKLFATGPTPPGPWTGGAVVTVGSFLQLERRTTGRNASIAHLVAIIPFPYLKILRRDSGSRPSGRTAWPKMLPWILPITDRRHLNAPWGQEFATPFQTRASNSPPPGR